MKKSAMLDHKLAPQSSTGPKNLRFIFLAIAFTMLESACQTVSVEVYTPTPEVPSERIGHGRRADLNGDELWLYLDLPEEWIVAASGTGNLEGQLTELAAVNADLYRFLLGQCDLDASATCLLVAYDGKTSTSSAGPRTLSVVGGENPTSLSRSEYLQKTSDGITHVPGLLSDVEGAQIETEAGPIQHFSFEINSAKLGIEDRAVQIHQYHLLSEELVLVFTFSFPVERNLSSLEFADAVMEGVIVLGSDGGSLEFLR